MKSRVLYQLDMVEKLKKTYLTGFGVNSLIEMNLQALLAVEGQTMKENCTMRVLGQTGHQAKTIKSVFLVTFIGLILAMQ